MSDWLSDVENRALVYRVLAAVAALAISVGVVTGEQAATALGVAAALLGTGGAVNYTRSKHRD